MKSESKLVGVTISDYAQERKLVVRSTSDYINLAIF